MSQLHERLWLRESCHRPSASSLPFATPQRNRSHQSSSHVGGSKLWRERLSAEPWKLQSQHRPSLPCQAQFAHEPARPTCDKHRSTPSEGNFSVLFVVQQKNAAKSKALRSQVAAKPSPRPMTWPSGPLDPDWASEFRERDQKRERERERARERERECVCVCVKRKGASGARPRKQAASLPRTHRKPQRSLPAPSGARGFCNLQGFLLREVKVSAKCTSRQAHWPPAVCADGTISNRKRLFHS